jgi:hypothetical protein
MWDFFFKGKPPRKSLKYCFWVFWGLYYKTFLGRNLQICNKLELSLELFSSLV